MLAPLKPIPSSLARFLKDHPATKVNITDALARRGSNFRSLFVALHFAWLRASDSRDRGQATHFKTWVIQLLEQQEKVNTELGPEALTACFNCNDVDIQMAAARALSYAQRALPPELLTKLLLLLVKSKNLELKRAVAFVDAVISVILQDDFRETELQCLLEAEQLPRRLRANQSLMKLAFQKSDVLIAYLNKNLGRFDTPNLPARRTAAKALFTLIEDLHSIPELARDAAKVERIKIALRGYLDRENEEACASLGHMGLEFETLPFLREDFLSENREISQRALFWLAGMEMLTGDKSHQSALAKDPRIIEKLMGYLLERPPVSIEAARVLDLLVKHHPENQRFIGNVHLPEGVISHLLHAAFSRGPDVDHLIVGALITLASCPDNDRVLLDPHNLSRVVYALSDYVSKPSPEKSETSISEALATLTRLMGRPGTQKAFFESLGMPKRAIDSLIYCLKHSSREVSLSAIGFLSQLAAKGGSCLREVHAAGEAILDQPKALECLVQASKSADATLQAQAITLSQILTRYVLEDRERKGEHWQFTQLAKIFQGNHCIPKWDAEMQRKAFAHASVFVNLLQYSTHWILDQPDVAVRSAAAAVLTLLLKHESDNHDGSLEMMAGFYNIETALTEYRMRVVVKERAAASVAVPATAETGVADKSLTALENHPYLGLLAQPRANPAAAAAAATDSQAFWSRLRMLGDGASKPSPSDPDDERTPFLAEGAASAAAAAAAAASASVPAAVLSAHADMGKYWLARLPEAPSTAVAPAATHQNRVRALL